MNFWQTVAQGIIFAGAVSGSLAVMWKWPLQPLWRKIRVEFKDAVRAVVVEELESIKSELTFNGGNSVKDIVHQISRQVEELHTTR